MKFVSRPMYRKAVGAFLMLGEKFTEIRDPHRRAMEPLRSRFYRSLWEAASAELGARLVVLDDDLFALSKGNLLTYVRRSEVALDARITLQVAGHKPLSYSVLGGQLPMAPHREFDLREWRAAWDWLQAVGGTGVAKPALAGSAGRGVTTGLDSPKKLRRAALKAAAYGGRILLEKQIPGASYRLLYLNGEMVDAVRRDPPTVTGDGRSTIAQLVESENRVRLSAPMTSMHPLSVDLEMKSHLAITGRTLKSVPGAGEVVIVKLVSNQNAARENVCVRDEVHPSIVDAGRTAARLLGVQLGGLDLITPDITRPLEETGGVVSEMNTTPALHHHYLISQPDRVLPIAEMVLEAVFANVKASLGGDPLDEALRGADSLPVGNG